MGERTLVELIARGYTLSVITSVEDPLRIVMCFLITQPVSPISRSLFMYPWRNSVEVRSPNNYEFRGDGLAQVVTN